MTEPLNVIQTIAKVKAAVGAVSKNRTMAGGGQDGGYRFRSIDDVYDACHGPMAEHGLVIVPHKIISNERRLFQYDKTDRQGNVVGTTRGVEIVMHILVRVYGPNGDHIELEVVGEAKDYSDKGSNKAHTAADKIAVTQTLKIPYREMSDPDEERPEETRQARQPKSEQPADWPVTRGYIKRELLKITGSEEKAIKAWDAFEKLGVPMVESEAQKFFAQTRKLLNEEKVKQLESNIKKAPEQTTENPQRLTRQDVANRAALVRRMEKMDNTEFNEALRDVILKGGYGFKTETMQDLVMNAPPEWNNKLTELVDGFEDLLNEPA